MHRPTTPNNQLLVTGNYLCEEFQESESDPLPERSFVQIREWTPKSELHCEQCHHSPYLEISKSSNVLSVYSDSTINLSFTDSVLKNSPTHFKLFVIQQYLQCFHGHLWTCTEEQKFRVLQYAHSQPSLNEAVLCLLVSIFIV